MRSALKFSSSAFAGAFAVAALWASAASASTVDFVTSSVSVNDASFSTGISYSSPGLNNNITSGTPLTINDFITGTVTGVNKSEQSGTISAAFTFTEPTAANGTDSGTIVGSFSGNSSNLKEIDITWSDPITVAFTDGVNLQIDLANVALGCPSPSCATGNTFDVAGTFTLLDGPTATPLPATLPLFAGGLGFVGYLAKRRISAKRALAAANKTDRNLTSERPPRGGLSVCADGCGA